MRLPAAARWERADRGDARPAVREDLLVALAVLAGWVLLSAVGQVTAPEPRGTAAMFLPVAFVAGVLARCDYRSWPCVGIGVLGGAATVAVVSGGSVGWSVGSGAANLVEAAVVAGLVRASGAADFRRPRDAAILVGAGAVGALLGALLGAVVAGVAGQADPAAQIVRWATWDLTAIACLTPVVLVARWPQRLGPRAGLRAALASALGYLALTGVTVVLALLVWWAPWGQARGDLGRLIEILVVPYLILLLQVAIGAAYGTLGVGPVVVLVAWVSLAAAADGRGPLPYLVPGGSAQDLALPLVEAVRAVTLYWLVLVLEDRRRADRSAAQAGRAAQAMFDGSPVPTARVVPHRAGGRLLAVNEAWLDLVGRDRPDLVGLGLLDLVHPQDRDAIAALLREPDPGAPRDRDVRLRRPDGAVLLVRLTVVGLDAMATDEDGPTLIVVAEDVTARRAAEAELVRRARHDGLTGVLTREVFLEQLTVLLATLAQRPGRLAVLFVDLDRFKQANDLLGHHVGDHLLREVAGLLRGALRPADPVGRYGGDEFVAACPGIRDEADARALAERVRAAVRHRLTVDGQAIALGASVGVALTDDPAADPEDLVRRADAAMYAAKAGGRDRVALAAGDLDGSAPGPAGTGPPVAGRATVPMARVPADPVRHSRDAADEVSVDLRREGS